MGSKRAFIAQPGKLGLERVRWFVSNSELHEAFSDTVTDCDAAAATSQHFFVPSQKLGPYFK